MGSALVTALTRTQMSFITAASRSPRRHRAHSIAWGLVAIVIIQGMIHLTVWGSQLSNAPAWDDVVQGVGWAVAVPLTFAVLGALIIAKMTGNRVGWLLMLTALTAVNPVGTYTQYLLNPPQAVAPVLWVAIWFDSWSWIPAIFPIFLIPLHFPTGKPPSPRWNWVNYLAVALWLILASLIAFSERIGPLNADWQVRNPVGFIPMTLFDETFSLLWGLGLIITVVGSVASLFIRYRRGRAGERQQIKWLLYAGGLFTFYYAVSLFRTDDQLQSGWSNLFFILSVVAMPLAIGIAILRYRLYDIDIIIRRTLLYALLTAALALVYFGSVVVIQTAVGRTAGEQSPVTIVFSTLLVAALFSPLRRRMQALIDRRFYRRKYDAAQTLARFAQSARDETDVQALLTSLAAVIQETVEPKQLGLWLRELNRE